MRRSILSATGLTAILALLVAIVAAALPVRGGAAPAINYHLARTVQLAGEGGWDYLTYDPAGKRLFISRGTPGA